MKKSKIVAPALAMIAFATAASITGTVAWFTANNSVKVTGMTFKTRVADNLFVSADTTEANFTDSINQAVKGILLPTSTVDGVSYYYTVDAKADGSAKAGYALYSAAAATDTTKYADKFSEDYKITKTEAGGLITGETGAKPYLDYSFYLKANFVSGNETYLYMSECNLLYNSATITEKAWRVAMFVVDATNGSNPATCNEVTDANTAKLVTKDADNNSQLKSIIAPASAANQTAGKAVNGTTAGAVGDVQKANQGALVYTSASGQETKYFKVLVRLWLEGEDKTCTVDTFKSLNQLYSLSLAFETSTTNSAVSVISSTPAA